MSLFNRDGRLDFVQRVQRRSNALCRDLGRKTTTGADSVLLLHYQPLLKHMVVGTNQNRVNISVFRSTSLLPIVRIGIDEPTLFSL